MLGQKMPTIASNTRNPSIWTLPSNVIGPPGTPWPMPKNFTTTGTKSAAADARKTICMYRSTFMSGRDMMRLATEEPTMHATIIVAKIMPCGMSSPFGPSAGVHRNTNEYIDASNSDCIAPR